MSDEDLWLDDAQRSAWLPLVAFLETVPSQLDGQLKRDLGINHFEYSILAMLSESPDGSLAMSDLAGAAFGSLSRLSHAVGRLEKRGWVERVPGPTGRRRTLARLTDMGHEELEEGARLHVAEVRRLLIEPLTDREFRQLGAIARKVLLNADPERAAELAKILPMGD